MNRLMEWVDGRVGVSVILLVGLGITLVYGASSYEMAQHHASNFYLSRQFQRVFFAAVACLVAMCIPYRKTAIFAQWGVLGSIALLFAVKFIPGFGIENEGIGRWGSLLGMVFQPVELAKVSLVLALPAWIDRDPVRFREDRVYLLRTVAPVLAVVGLLAMQPNFGSALAIVLITAILLWVGGMRARDYLLLVTIGLLVAGFAATHSTKLESRTQAWVRLLLTEQADDGVGYQPYQAITGLGNGGLLGAPTERGITRYEFLPDQHTDFVFAVAGERLGLLGTLAIVTLFTLLIARALKIARHCKDGQGYLTAMSIAAMIGVYSILNLAMVTALIPVAGLPLPFLSYGGTALITNMFAIGVLLNIAGGLGRPRRSKQRFREVRR